MPLHADGEDLGDVEHAVFEAERDAVSVLSDEGRGGAALGRGRLGPERGVFQ